MEIKGKSFLVAGMGKSGIAAMRTLLKDGGEVYIYDKKAEEEVSDSLKEEVKGKVKGSYFGVLPEKDRRFDFMVISPGVPLDEDIAVYGKTNCGEIIGELELAYRLSKGRYIAITGTNGKTTTTTLVGEILEKSGAETYVVGNIGYPVIDAAELASDKGWFVAEVSSFQLETIRDFGPKVSAILNITPDHLNRHKTMENYAAAKAEVFRNQTADDYFVVNKDNPEAFDLAKNCPAKVVPFSRLEELEEGCFVKDGNIVIKEKGGDSVVLCAVEDIGIPGAHNLENVLAAAAVSWCAGISPEMIKKSVREFEGVEHRIEFVAEIDGVRYYNDSKGTNTDASGKAIDALEKNIILLAGGYDKKEDFNPFIASFGGRVKQMYLIGQTAGIIAEACDNNGFKAYTHMETLKDCVEAAKNLAQPGDIVLLSPACASWGMYNNYEERGADFKNCVKSFL